MWVRFPPPAPIAKRVLEIYGGIVGLIFAAVGIRLGQTLTRDKVVVVHGPPVATPFVRDRANRGIRPHPREIEILEQIAGGFSAREIAARLFVSGNA